MHVFLCANIGQKYLVYFYVSGIWDKEVSQFNKKSYLRKNTYERVRPDIMYSFFMLVEIYRFMYGFVSVVLHSVLHFKNKLEWRIDK